MAYKFKDVDDSWENPEIKYVECCGTLPKFSDVFIAPLVEHKVKLLIDAFNNLEWLAYLIPDEKDDNVIKDIYVPFQKVTSADVHVDQKDRQHQRFVGIIHSHHNMSIGFSGIDHDGVNKNHYISLLVNNKDKWIGQVRLSTACGLYLIVPAVIKRWLDTTLDVKEYGSEIKEKIKTAHMDYNYGYGMGHCKPPTSKGVTVINGKKKENDPEDINDILELDALDYITDESTLDEEEMFDTLSIIELHALGKVRTMIGYRDIKTREHNMLDQYAYGEDTWLASLESLNFQPAN